MTRDLLGLLAMQAGKPVGVDAILDMLWPDVDASRGRASLRTAASQIRKVVGSDCLERREDALVLIGAWVDTDAFRGLAAQALAHFGAGRQQAGLDQAWEALALVTGEVLADRPYADWVAGQRTQLRAAVRHLRLEAASAALAIARWRDAVALAEPLAFDGQVEERACQVLMRAYQRLGARDTALRVYAHCMAALADELGIDPSPETQALHLQLLQADKAGPGSAPMIGRRGVLATINRAIASGARVVRVTGPAGSGRTRVLEEVAAAAPHGAVLLGGLRPGGALGSQILPADQRQVLVCIDDADDIALDEIAELLERAPGAVVVLAHRPRGLRWSDGYGAVIPLHPLLPRQVRSMLVHLLHGQPSPQLVDEVVARTAGWPGLVAADAARLADTGTLQATASGLVWTAEAGGPPPTGQIGGMLDRVRTMLDADGLAVFEALAVLGEAPDASVLADICRLNHDVVEGVLDLLADLAIVTCARHGCRFRHPEVQELAYRWLRPSVRRMLHQRVAGNVDLPVATRVQHWERAGEPTRQPFGVDPDDAGAAPRGAIVVPLPLSDVADASPAQQLAVLEATCRAGLETGRLDLSIECSTMALAMAERRLPAALPRLWRQRAELMVPGEDSLGYCLRGLAAVAVDDATERAELELTAGNLLARWSQVSSEQHFRQSVHLGVLSGHASLQVRSRAALARGLLSMRQVDAAEGLLNEAAGIAAGAGDDALLSGVLLALGTARLWTGHAATARVSLLRALGLADRKGSDALKAEILMALVWAGHASGGEEPRTMWAAASGYAERTGQRDRWALVAALVTLENGWLADSAASISNVLGQTTTPLQEHQWALLLAARLELRRSDPVRASRLLRDAIVLGEGSKAMLLLPEAHARLAAIEALDDPETGMRRLGRIAEFVGAETSPREQSVILAQRAEVHRLAGNLQAAADLALAGRVAAEKAGLVHLLLEAIEVHQRCLQDLDDGPGAERLAAMSLRLRRQATTVRERRRVVRLPEAETVTTPG